MNHRPLPRTGLSLSEVALDLAGVTVRGETLPDEHDWAHLTALAFDLGITLFVTGDPELAGEELLRKTLAASRRELIIATRWEPAPQDWTPVALRKACEERLRRLHTDYLDLFIPIYPKQSLVEEASLLAALAQLQKDGKVRYPAAGVSASDDAVATGSAVLASKHFHALELAYSLAQRDSGKLFQPARAAETGLLVRDALAPLPKGHPAMESVAALHQSHGVSAAYVALRFALLSPTVVSASVQITSAQLLRELVASPAELGLSDTDLSQLRTPLAAAASSKSLPQQTGEGQDGVP